MYLKCLSLHLMLFGFINVVSAEENGYFLILRIKNSQIGQFKDDFKAQYKDLEERGAKLQAVSDHAGIKNADGQPWPQGYGIAVFYFPTSQGATDWLNSADDVKESDWLEGVDAILLKASSVIPGKEQGAFALALCRINDTNTFFNVYAPAAGPIVVKWKGAAGASGLEVATGWQSLRGSWVPEEPEETVQIFYFPSVRTTIDFFVSEDYRPAREMRLTVSECNMFTFPREIQVIPDTSAASSMGMGISAFCMCMLICFL